MKSLKKYLTVFSMLLQIGGIAQNKPAYTIQWLPGGELPPLIGQVSSLGYAGPVTGIAGDKLIIAGGANFPDSMPWLGGKKKYYDDVFIYQKKGRGIVAINKSYKLPSPIAYAATCTTPEGVFYAGGENNSGITSKAFLLTWDKKNGILNTQNLPNLPYALSNAAASANGSKIFIAGGETSDSTLDGLLMLDLKNITAGWKILPVAPKPLSHTVIIAQSDKEENEFIYLFGGRSKTSSGISNLSSDVFFFDMAKYSWISMPPLPYALSAGTGISVGKDKVILFGGDKGETFHKTEMLIAAIKNEADETKKKELSNLKAATQSSHPGFDRNILLYNSKTGDCIKIAEMPSATPVTTTALTWGDCFVIPSGEIRAGIRTPKILMGKLRRQQQ